VPRLVDLSQEIYQGMGVYPGHLKTVIWEHASHAETARLFEGGFSFHSSGLMMCDHGPTHVDALSHLDPSEDAPSIDEMPLDTFYGPALCLDVSHVEAPDYVTVADLESALGDARLELNAGDALLLRTGTHDRYGGTPEYTSRYPGLDDDAAGWLRDRGVKVFGVDSPSPDNPLSRTYPVHMMCRASGITHYENLANLAAVAGRRFTFIGFPLRIRAGTGSPVRAVAVLGD
jgi:kynurenine formamidase